MSGSMTVSPVAPASDWSQWENQGNVPPPTAPQISDNPTQDAAPGSSTLQRALAMLRGTGGSAAVNPTMPGADASAPGGPVAPVASAMAPGAPMPADTPVPPIPPSAPPVAPVAAANNAPLQPGGAPVPRGAGGLPVAPAGLAVPTTMPVGNPGAPPLTTSAQAAPVTGAALAPGDPTKVYSMVVPGESGGSAGAVNKTSGAMGTAQFLQSTANDFLASPANVKPGGGKWTSSDFTDPTNGPAVGAQATTWLAGVNNGIFQSTLGRPATQPELVAAHMLGGTAAAALAARPTMPMIAALSKVMSPTKAAQIAGANPGVYNPNMTGAQALAAIPSYYGGHAVAGIGGAPSGGLSAIANPAPTTGQSPSGQTNDLASMLTQIKGFQTPLPYPNAAKLPAGSQMLALASGLLSGHSMADAFGKGFGALNAVQGHEQGVQMEANKETGTLNNQQASLAQQAIAHQEMVKLMGQRVGIQQERLNFQQDPEAQKALAAAKTSGSTESASVVKDNMHDTQEIDEAGINANKNLPAMQGLLQQIDKSGAGPGIVSAFKRRLALAFDVPVGNTDPTATQLTAAYSSMGQSQAAQAMKGLGLRTQNEFNTFIKGVGTLDNDPSVVKTLIGQVSDRAQADAQMYSDYHAMAPEDKAKMLTTPSGVAGFRSKYVQGVGAAQGVRVTPPGTTQAPAATGGSVKMTGPGGTFNVPAEKVALFKQNGYQ